MITTSSQDNAPFRDVLNTWLQTIGIMIAAVWALSTFIFKEFTQPHSAPVNISVDLALRRSQTPGSKRNLVPIEMQVTAKNPSSRVVYLLPSIWTAWGTKVVDDPVEKLPAGTLDVAGLHAVTKDYVRTPESLLAVGGLFEDTLLKPGETTKRTLIFYARPDEYDVIDVRTIVPSTGKGKALWLEWVKGKDARSVAPRLWKIERNGSRTELKQDVPGHYSVPKIELQEARSSSEIALDEVGPR